MRLPTSARWVSDDEWDICTAMFGEKYLPSWRRIFITNGNGYNGAPFTIPSSLVSELSSFGDVFKTLLGHGFINQMLGANLVVYLINVGPDLYNDMTDSSKSGTLVHEMTHVWQGENSNWTNEFVFSSVINRALKGGDEDALYGYRPLRNWTSYNSEQQAKLVEDWYDDAKGTTSDLYPYIRDFVRNGIC